MPDFPTLLDRFAAAVVANDGIGLAALFTEDGTYDDGFFGPHSGRPAIAQMLQRFHDTGRDYRWDWSEPLTNGTTAYASWRFSYASRLPGSEGKPVMFEGISRFQFRGDLIARYAEAFDRGVALVQLAIPPDRIAHILEKAVAEQNATAEAREHLDRFGNR